MSIIENRWSNLVIVNYYVCSAGEVFVSPRVVRVLLIFINFVGICYGSGDILSVSDKNSGIV